MYCGYWLWLEDVLKSLTDPEIRRGYDDIVGCKTRTLEWYFGTLVGAVTSAASVAQTKPCVEDFFESWTLSTIWKYDDARDNVCVRIEQQYANKTSVRKWQESFCHKMQAQLIQAHTRICMVSNTLQYMQAFCLVHRMKKCVS